GTAKGVEIDLIVHGAFGDSAPRARYSGRGVGMRATSLQRRPPHPRPLSPGVQGARGEMRRRRWVGCTFSLERPGNDMPKENGPPGCSRRPDAVVGRYAIRLRSVATGLP